MLRRAYLWSLGLVALSFVIALALYGRLPDPVPTHWDFHGNVDGWTPKPWGAFVLPLGHLVTLAILVVVPLLSPRRFSIKPFAGTYGKIVVVINLFLLATSVFGLTLAAGIPIVSSGRFINVSIGLLLVLLGNYFGKMTPNFFAGIRTPWTLASPEVWSRTHRLGGWLAVGGGALLVVTGLIRPSAPLTLAVMGVVVIAPIVFSYAIYRRLEIDSNGDDAERDLES